MSKTEYRVRWRREGRGQTTRIYQSWSAAYRKAQGILALEAVKDETSFETMPSLAEGPVIESRSVGEWEPMAVDVLSEGREKAMLEWAEVKRVWSVLTSEGG